MAGMVSSLGPGVAVLASHPCGLHALLKPAGVRSHPNAAAVDPKALLRLPYDAGAEAFVEGDRRWHLLHRLDAPTSGVILVTDQAPVAATVPALFEGREVAKVYLALVRGKPAGRSQEWKDTLRTRREGATVRTGRGGADLAVAAMRLRATGAGMPLRSLLELSPRTGRTHQLRIQCAERRLPIIGDATYGDFRFNRECAQRWGTKRLFLHAWRLELAFKLGSRSVSFRAEAPLPEEFGRAMG